MHSIHDGVYYSRSEKQEERNLGKNADIDMELENNLVAAVISEPFEMIILAL